MSPLLVSISFVSRKNREKKDSLRVRKVEDLVRTYNYYNYAEKMTMSSFDECNVEQKIWLIVVGGRNCC